MKLVRVIQLVKLNKITMLLLITVLSSAFCVILWYQRQYKATATSKSLWEIKVLILYSSGNPTCQWDVIVPNISEDIDAITTATSKAVNTNFIAKSIANYLKQDGLQVSLKRIEDIKKAQEVLFADAILIGSGTRFGIMSWQVKRFFDELLFAVYIHRKERLSDKYVGCFTTCEVYRSGKDCIKSIRRALCDFKPKKIGSLIILDKTPENEIQKKVNEFTREMIAKLENAYGL